MRTIGYAAIVARKSVKKMAGALTALSLVLSAAPASAYTALYSFGDSLSDVGNIFAASGGTVPTPLFPSGEPAYYDGRFSNGPNWVDDLSAKLGLGPVSASADGGNDFAVGGAQTGPTSVNPAKPGANDLTDQIAAYEQTHPTPVLGALYTLDIGSNDIGYALFAYAKNPSFDFATFMTEAVANTVGAVDALYADGARDLLYYQVPDISLVPAAKAFGTLGGELAMEFNDDVLAGIKPLEAEGLTVFDMPTFSALQTIVSYPARFGFTNVTGPCISGDYYSPGTRCADPNQYLFWDEAHPTAAANALTAKLAYATLTGAPDPITAPELSTWAMMLIGFAGLGIAGYRASRRTTVTS